ncbi:dual serine/threonine and tyrosine protein kinase-like isoform X2 [Xenia sp. Carnegie-2017]|uniref:dual serine/threonine and tyrosine protein kinase-like isoform X2 n=1 Tax=Xenia sp. Carnegie-2017 TaxID=2897299 RepID=UPI001F037052|nr:dual serine/threonine and tyrosine protein kinase-like isoform X2 [Xenia sp. Carnegie-2017]
MARKSVADLKKLTEILELFEILNVEYDDDLDKSELKKILQQLLQDQSSDNGQYSNGISGLEIICDAKRNDKEKREKLICFYTKLEECLSNLGDQDLSILEDLLGVDIAVNNILSEMKSKLIHTQYYLLISGETSCGKSTLINLILNEDILPCHTLHKTANIWEISYGGKRTVVVHYKTMNGNEECPPLPKQIPIESRENCGKSFSEQLESCVANEQLDLIEKFELYWPHDLLKQGVVIFDSPGVGHSDEMDAILMKYLPIAFAYIYVIDIPHAGGIDKVLKKKMKAMAEKINLLFDSVEHMSRLTECTLFIGNKWDMLKKKSNEEKEKVKRNVYDELKDCWGMPNIEKHVIFMSATDAITVQDYGGSAPEFKILLENIHQLILRSIILRLYNHWQWLDTIMSETVTLSNFYDQTVCDLQDKRHQVQLLSERAIKIQQTYSKHETQLLTNLERQQNALSNKIKEHISLKEFEHQLFSWESKYAFDLLGSNWEKTKENVDKAIVRKYLHLLDEWEKKEKVYAKIHSAIVDDHLKSFNLLKEDLERFEGIGSSIKRQVAYFRNRSQTLPTKVLVGAASPIWLPVAAAGIFLSAPVIGFMTFFKMIDHNKHKLEFSENPVKYMKQRSQKFLEAKRKEEILTEAVQVMAKTKKIVSAYHNLIPRRIEADRKMVKQLKYETRNQDKVYKEYKNIFITTQRLREEMIDLGEELFPELLDRRDLAWSTAEHVFVGEGEFSKVYRGHLKIFSRSEMTDVAVKVFNKPFDDINTRFYFNEEIKIRHLKHQNVLKFLGAIKIETCSKSKYCYIFVMPICKINLREHLFNSNSCPTQSNDTKQAIMKYFTYAKQIADGLNYIHEMGLVHRHLKLENVLVTNDDKVAISDVGIVGQFKEAEESLIYLAPEVLKNLEHRIKPGDIYSFGIMLWEMWYGVTAFRELMPIIRENFRAKLLDGHRPEIMEQEVNHPKARETMEDCWTTCYEKRITAKNCFDRLEFMVNSFKNKKCSNSGEHPHRREISIIGGSSFIGDNITVNMYNSN